MTAPRISPAAPLMVRLRDLLPGAADALAEGRPVSALLLCADEIERLRVATAEPAGDVRPATPLPWHDFTEDDGEITLRGGPGGGDEIGPFGVLDRASMKDAAYIVTACNGYPALLAERQRLRSALASAEERTLIAEQRTAVPPLREPSQALSRVLTPPAHRCATCGTHDAPCHPECPAPRGAS